MLIDFFIAAFLGFVEGLTEFLPVSSTAHLIVLTEGLGFPAPPGHVFEVFIQIGAILAVVVLYWPKIWATVTGLPRGDVQARHFTINIILGVIPALVAGALAHDWVKAHLYNPFVISAALITGGVVILLLERHFDRVEHTGIDNITPRKAFLVGCCQALALVPGVSRSGATIMGALSLGLSRPAAAEFSFFLAIPVMFAAVGYDLLKNWAAIVAYDHFGVMFTGLVAAFITALLVVRSAIAFISRYGFVPFAWYRIIAGCVILFVFW